MGLGQQERRQRGQEDLPHIQPLSASFRLCPQPCRVSLLLLSGSCSLGWNWPGDGLLAEQAWKRAARGRVPEYGDCRPQDCLRRRMAAIGVKAREARRREDCMKREIRAEAGRDQEWKRDRRQGPRTGAGQDNVCTPQTIRMEAAWWQGYEPHLQTRQLRSWDFVTCLSSHSQ